jgi:Xaa-Pro aminopeptidase
MAAHEVGHLLVYGANRSGSAVGWLTRWPVTREALVVVTPGERDVLLVDFYNHVPNAARIATEADVRPAAPSGIATAVEALRARGAAGRRVGLIGPLGHAAHARLAEAVGEVVALDGAYTRLRLVKSSEEIAWLRVGCELTDAAVVALRDGARPGVDERALGALVEGAYLGRGGTTHIHPSPRRAWPRRRWPSRRSGRRRGGSRPATP